MFLKRLFSKIEVELPQIGIKWPKPRAPMCLFLHGFRKLRSFYTLSQRQSRRLGETERKCRKILKLLDDLIRTQHHHLFDFFTEAHCLVRISLCLCFDSIFLCSVLLSKNKRELGKGFISSNNFSLPLIFLTSLRFTLRRRRKKRGEKKKTRFRPKTPFLVNPL